MGKARAELREATQRSWNPRVLLGPTLPGTLSGWLRCGPGARVLGRGAPGHHLLSLQRAAMCPRPRRQCASVAQCTIPFSASTVAGLAEVLHHPQCPRRNPRPQRLPPQQALPPNGAVNYQGIINLLLHLLFIKATHSSTPRAGLGEGGPALIPHRQQHPTGSARLQIYPTSVTSSPGWPPWLHLDQHPKFFIPSLRMPHPLMAFIC